MDNNNQQQQQQQYQQPPQYYYHPQYPPGSSPGLGIASMVLGIFSLITCWVFYIAIPCSILAIILGAVGNKPIRRGRGMAVAGIATGIIGLVLAVIFIVLIVLSLAVYTTTYDWYYW
jgi:hypothetical protein